MPKGTVCNACEGRGYLEKVCFKATKSINQLDANSYGLEIDEICNVEAQQVPEQVQDRGKFTNELVVNEQRVKFEVDSGAAVTLMWMEQAKQLFPRTHLQHSSLQLVTFCKTTIQV